MTSNSNAIFIVDDRSRVRDALEKMLSGQDYDLAFARDDFETLEKASELIPIDLRHEAVKCKQAEEEIKKFKTISDNANYGVAMLDLDGRITYANEHYAAMHGYSSEEVVGKALNIFLDDGQLEEIEQINRELEENGSYSSQEIRHKRKNGSVFPALTNGLIIKDEKGKPLFMSLTTVDITESKRAEIMKDEFISTASHELRTPVTSIHASLGLVLGGVAGELPEPAKKLLNIAYSNSERLINLINDVLDMEKLDLNKMELRPEPMELMPLVEQALEDSVVYAMQFEVSVVLKVALSGVKVNVDSDRIMQVFANLLSNAVKFSPSNGIVEVTVSRHEKAVRVAITDHGPGIPDEFRDNIFQRYVQANYSNNRRKGGIGLGLSIAKAIVEKHNGQIDFDTEVGVGSTFYFDLPEWY